MELDIIAHIHTDFSGKFGIPRQSGMIPELTGQIVFTEKYRNTDAIRGLEDFSHLWLLWEFSEAIRDDWSPTVRPPRLGGNARMGVFATRSPFRPNPLGLSCVQLDCVEYTKQKGAILHVCGVDLMDGTPIYDIKPYLPYTDCQPEATGGFTDELSHSLLQVEIPDSLKNTMPSDKLAALYKILEQDPRPSYQKEAERIYAFEFAGVTIRFQVQDTILSVLS
ncbi:MAG: tRNA (N6-threonylcarbamoyladenosine(37)-N6)-methyltransferase TrmO [Lachnospiraceae bacterium]|nr:tRNA (N6-threonylcarbamoyladenosine(37)-N6)-methyltransferase TrmO [Lachnospiraceae bacterium]